MKRFFTAIMLSGLLAISAYSQAPTTYFQYPTVPDSISTLQGRANFLVDHFWDYCDLKKAFSSRAKMAGAFSDYLSFMPHATADTVYMSIDKFLKKLEKQPNDLLFIARKAEEYLYSDSAKFWSDELYLPFARAVAKNKKIDKANKQRFEHFARILSSTQIGMPAPELKYTDRNGNPGTYAADTTYSVTVLFFNDPDCDDCRLARARLNADIKASYLQKQGIMRVVSICPGEADDAWKDAVKTYPENWAVGATPDADEIYDIRNTPSFYLIDENNVIQAKNIGIDEVIAIITRL